MKISTEKLIEELIEDTRQLMNEAESFRELPVEKLNWRAEPDSWSVLECLEHLNLYGDYYLPELEKGIRQNNFKPSNTFKSGLLGNYFALSMLPKEKLNKMKTFKDKNPVGSALDKSTIDRFVNQQKKMLELLKKSRGSNLNRVKIPITIARFIKLKLGDTFRFVIFHNKRHLVQAQRVLKEQKISNHSGSLA